LILKQSRQGQKTTKTKPKDKDKSPNVEDKSPNDKDKDKTKTIYLANEVFDGVEMRHFDAFQGGTKCRTKSVTWFADTDFPLLKIKTMVEKVESRCRLR
jgi:hypothetical protein